VKLFQLPERQPDQVFAAGRVQFDLQATGDFRRGCPAVAMTPDECGRAVQAMSLVTIEIVNQNFIRQILNY
jgi:hypothetical protein